VVECVVEMVHRGVPPKIEKNVIFFWRKIVIFHTKYPKKFRASLRSAQFFKCAPPLTLNPGSAPGSLQNHIRTRTVDKPYVCHNGPSWSWSYGTCNWIYNYLCKQCLSPLMLWVGIQLMVRCTRYNIMWWKLSVTCDRSVVFSGYSCFLHQ
jgi:hypothetical protein